MSTALRHRAAGHRGAAPTFVTLAVLLSLAVLTCCSAQAARSGTTTSRTPSDDAARSAAETLITDDPAARQDRWRLFRAEQVLVERCMREAGHRYLVTSPGPKPPAGLVTDDVVDDGGPATYGVTGSAVHTLGPADRPAQDAYVAGLPDAERTRYLTALNGSREATTERLRLPSGTSGSYATGGCVARAREELYGSVRAALEDTLVPQDVTRTFAVHLESDDGFRASLADWRACMTAAGWDVASPADAVRSLEALAAEGIGEAELRARERALADTDVACDRDSGLRRRIAEARADFVARQPPETSERLRQVQLARRNALRRTDEVLA